MQLLVVESVSWILIVDSACHIVRFESGSGSLERHGRALQVARSYGAEAQRGRSSLTVHQL